MMTTKFIEQSLDENNVAWIKLNRPQIHNAFNDEMIAELISALNTLNEPSSPHRVLVITGMGNTFCAGADMDWMRKMKSLTKEENLLDAKKLAHLFYLINGHKKPVIVAVNGHALGGGVGLVAAGDFALCLDNSLFGLTEVRLGILPAVISPFVMAKIGESNARAYFLSGLKFSAIQALQMNLVHKVVAADLFDSELKKIIEEFLKAGPHAQILAKELIVKNLSLLQDLDQKINFTTELISQVRVSKEGQEGLISFLEKRSPQWISKINGELK